MKKLIILLFPFLIFSQAPIVGDYYEGGVVFWVNPDDDSQGLVCDIVNLYEDNGQGYIWGCWGSFVSGSMGYDVGTGNQNTFDIIDYCDEIPIAASVCAESNNQGYDDWFLPSTMTLYEIYLNKEIINEVSIANGGEEILSDWYWSSTQIDAHASRMVHLGSGVYQNPYGPETKYANHIVRAVREYIYSDPIFGCTDNTACNYNENVSEDDGSCVYADQYYDCDENPLNDEDGNGIADELEQETILIGDVDCSGEVNSQDAALILQYVTNVIDSLPCSYASINIDNQALLGCTDENASNYNNLATEDDGSCDTDGDGVADIDEVFGCPNENASNYNNLATEDDGSCDTDGDGVADIDEVFGCTDENASNYNNLATEDDGSCEELAIGDTYQGGIVFYLDGNGGGLIAASSDDPSSAYWGCVGTITGSSGTAIGTGAQNTIDIEAGCTTAGTAADICANLTLNGYSDWYLPSKDELAEMYYNISWGSPLGNIGGFAGTPANAVGDYYWSSTEQSADYAWWGYFSSNYYNEAAGIKGYDSSTQFSIRPIRSF